MWPSAGILHSRPSLLAPDVNEDRGGRRLLVWGGLPHWMVVDAEMASLLARLDGTVTLASAADETGLGSRALARLARDFLRRGILRTGAASPALPPPTYKIESIALNLTARCNLQCAFCYNRGRSSPPADAAPELSGTEENIVIPLPACGERVAEGRVRGAPEFPSPYPLPQEWGRGTENAGAPPGAEISADEIIRFLEGARPITARGASLVILGGEPFLEPQKLLAVAARARRMNLKTLVSTNGTLVTPDLAAKVRRAGLAVQVSIDGPDAATHDAVRGRGSFERTAAGLRTLVGAGVHTVASMVCHEGNIERLEAFFDLALATGAREARFIPLKQMGAAGESGFRPVPMSRLMSEAAALLARRPDLGPLLGRDALSILANTCRYSARRPSCGTGLQTVLLDADGSVYPCLNLNQPRFRIASIRQAGYDWPEVWRQSVVLRSLRHDTSVENPERACSRCPVRHWCLGGCRGETLAVTGDLRGPSPDCRDLRRTLLDMMWRLADTPGLVRPAVKIC